MTLRWAFFAELGDTLAPFTGVRDGLDRLLKGGRDEEPNADLRDTDEKSFQVYALRGMRESQACRASDLSTVFSKVLKVRVRV